MRRLLTACVLRHRQIDLRTRYKTTTHYMIYKSTATVSVKNKKSERRVLFYFFNFEKDVSFQWSEPPSSISRKNTEAYILFTMTQETLLYFMKLSLISCPRTFLFLTWGSRIVYNMEVTNPDWILMNLPAPCPLGSQRWSCKSFRGELRGGCQDGQAGCPYPKHEGHKTWEPLPADAGKWKRNAMSKNGKPCTLWRKHAQSVALPVRKGQRKEQWDPASQLLLLDDSNPVQYGRSLYRRINFFTNSSLK